MERQSRSDNLIDRLFASPRKVLVSVLFVLGACVAGVQDLTFSMDYQIFFGGDDIHIKAFNTQQKIYSKNDNILLAIEPQAKYVFDLNLLRTIKRYTEQAWKLPHVTRVDSITNFQDSFAEGDDLVIEDLYRSDSVPRFSLDRVRQVATTEPALVNRLVSKNGRYTGIALTISLPAAHKNTASRNVVAAARELAARLRAEPAIKGVYLSGTVMINNAFYEVAKRDLVTLIPIMFAVILLLMRALIRSLPTTLLVFGLVGLAVGTAFGAGAWLGIELTPPSAAAAPIIMTISIAHSVHILLSYYRLCRRGHPREEAMKRSLKSNLLPVTLTSVTTIIGFLTMNFSESPPFNHLGNLVAIGALAAYVISVLVMPLLQVRFSVPVYGTAPAMETWLNRLGIWVGAQRRWLVISTLALVAVLATFVSRNELNDEFIKYFDTSVTFRQDNDFITKNLTGVYQIEYSLDAERANGINDPAYLSTLEAFRNWFLAQDFVLHVQTISDVYKKANMNLHNNAMAYYAVPETNELAAQALLAYELSLPPGLDLNDQINVDKSASKFIVSLQTVSANDILALEKKAQEWLAGNAPSAMRDAIGTGPTVLFAHIGKRSIRSGLFGAGCALLLICAILSLVFRSFKLGVISIVPNLFPASMAFGVWGAVNGQINMALATVVSMTLGIIVDDTIHFISRYRRGLAAGLSEQEAVGETFTTVGVAIVVTTVILTAGFLVLTFSPFVMNWGMGLVTAMTIVFALLTDLLLLPAILIVFDKRKTHESLVTENAGV